MGESQRPHAQPQGEEEPSEGGAGKEQPRSICPPLQPPAHWLTPRSKAKAEGEDHIQQDDGLGELLQLTRLAPGSGGARRHGLVALLDVPHCVVSTTPAPLGMWARREAAWGAGVV